MPNRRSSTGVVYLLTDPRLAARLVVSLYSLRRWYSGPITVFTTRARSNEIGRCCAGDATLSVHHVVVDEVRGANTYAAAYQTKVAAVQASPYRNTIYIDADTLIANRIDELLESTRNNPLVLTGFFGTSTNTGGLKERLNEWRTVCEYADPSFGLSNRIDELTANPHPAINAGVLGLQRNDAFVARWRELTHAGRLAPLCDEVALQIMAMETSYEFLGYKYNCHPMAWPSVTDVSIFHFAGITHLRDGCHELWVPAWQECVDRNVAEIQNWSRVVRATETHQQSNVS